MIIIGDKRTYERREILAVGVLLHDIGKLVQRASDHPTDKTHSKFGEEWMSENELLRPFALFAGFHHDHEDSRDMPLMGIARLADWISAGERHWEEEEKEEGRWNWSTKLLSPFCKIGYRPEDSSFKAYYQEIVQQSDDNLFHILKPHTEEQTGVGRGDQKVVLRSVYKCILEAFEADLRSFGKEISVNNLLFLLEKYTSTVPSYMREIKDNPWKNPDISLYDHSRMSAAIALCLYDYCAHKWGHDETAWDRECILAGTAGNDTPVPGIMREETFLLAEVDLSGIQDFIYNITSKKAARSLRGRSFYLEMVVEDICMEVLRRLGLERFNIIFSGGGRAQLLLPNLEEVKECLTEVEKEANLFLQSKTGGLLSVNITHLSLPGENMVIRSDVEKESPLHKVMRELGREKRERKYTRLSRYLAEGVLEVGPFKAGSEECGMCHVETDIVEVIDEYSEEGREFIVCPFCRSLVELGGRLKSSGVIYLFAKDSIEKPSFFVELPFSLLGLEKPKGRTKVAFLLGDRWNVNKHEGPEYVGFAYPSYRLSRKGKEKEFITLEDMAREGLGAERIGVLRMDVDDLGYVLGAGVWKEEFSFTRYAVLSRMLNQFFREILPSVTSGRWGNGFFDMLDYSETENGNRERALEIIYAGGDDLFIVGAWNDVLDAAFDIYSAFKSITCNNPNVHISGGLAIHCHDYPVYFLAEMSKSEEDKAKEVVGKGSFSVWGVADKWERYEMVRDKLLRPLLTLETKEGRVKVIDAAKEKEKHEEGMARYKVELEFPRGFLRELAAIFKEAASKDGRFLVYNLCYLLARARERLGRDKGEDWIDRWKSLERALLEVRQKSDFRLICNLLGWADLMSRGG